MDWWTIITLGILEGITEFLPISSTGHLIIAQDLLNASTDSSNSFVIAIQSGAILAVIFKYSHRFLDLLHKVPERNFSGIYGCWLLLLTTVPALLFGFLAHDWITEVLFNSTNVAVALVIGGIVLICVEMKQLPVATRSIDELTAKKAFAIGLWQCLALCPGVSRSAATIIGGMFLGLERKIAAQYSFFAGVPVLLAATAYVLYKSTTTLSMERWGALCLGTALSFITALGAIHFFIRILEKYTLAPFGYYRIILGSLILLLI